MDYGNSLSTPLLLTTEELDNHKNKTKFLYRKPEEKLCQAQKLLPCYFTHYENLQQGSIELAANLTQVLEANKSDETLIQFLSKKIYMLVHNTPFVELQKACSALSSLLYQPKEKPKISLFFHNEDFPSFESILQKQNSPITTVENPMQDSLSNLDQTSQGNPQQHQQASLISSPEVSEDQQIFLRAFNFFGGKIPNLVRPYLHFPKFFSSVLSSLEHVFGQGGPLSFESAYYIAIMSASANMNNYIFNLFAEIFEHNQENSISWLEEGFTALPEKLKKTWEICAATLQHPSILLTHHMMLFQHLLSCKQGNNLSINEVIMSIFIILIIENLSTVSFGHGLLEEYDCQQDIKKQRVSSPQTLKTQTSISLADFDQVCQQQQSSSVTLQQQQQQQTTQLMKNKDLFEESKAIVSHSQPELEGLLDSEEEQSPELFTSSQQQNKFESYIGKTQINWNHNDCCPQPLKNKAMKRKSQFFLTDDDYNWKNNCQAILKQVEFEKLTDIMQERLDILKLMKFESSFGQTAPCQQQQQQQKYDGSPSSKHKRQKAQSPQQKMQSQQQQWQQLQQQTVNGSDSKEYLNNCAKSAIWNYVRIVLGYKDMHCDFEVMNKMLNRPFKSFIKKLVLWPWEVKKSDFDLIPNKLSLRDLSLIIILVSEAKLFTRLLYFLHSFEMYYRKKNSNFQVLNQ